MNKDINEDGYYTGAELQWGVVDVERCIEDDYPQVKISEEDYERILIATFQDNEQIMEMINNQIDSTIQHMIEAGELETKPPTCCHCGDVEVETEGQPCSKECKDGYVYDWLTERS